MKREIDLITFISLNYFCCHSFWLDNLVPLLILKDAIKIKIIYLAHFDWLKIFWNFFNRSETINILAIKEPRGTKVIAQL